MKKLLDVKKTPKNMAYAVFPAKTLVNFVKILLRRFSSFPNMKLRFVFALIIAKVCSKILERDLINRLKKLQEEKNISLDEMTVLFDKIGSVRTKDSPMVCSFSDPGKGKKFNFEFNSKIPKNKKKYSFVMP